MRSILFTSLAFVAAACQSPTQLVVVVDSDFEVPKELASVQTIVSDDAGESLGSEVFDLGTYGLPLSFGIEGGDLSREQIQVLIQGLTPNDELLVDRAAIVGFVEGETRLLPIFLARQCSSTDCGEGRTCTELGCASAFVDVATLPAIEPGDELLHDAGVHPDGGPAPDSGVEADAGGDGGMNPLDSGVDGGTDGGTDSGPDSGPDSGADSGPDGDPDAASPDTGTDGGADAGQPSGCQSGCVGGELCVDPTGLDCAGGAGCECRPACDPFALGQCPIGEACWLRSTGDGVCLDQNLSTAANYAAPCNTQNDCDMYENFVCHQFGSNPGVCTSLCRVPEAQGFCDTKVQGTVCNVPPGGQLGACLEPPQPLGNLTAPCTVDMECSSANCLAQLGICSADCTQLHACPTGATCAFSTVTTDAWCLPLCTSSLECAANPGFTCRLDVGNPGLCFYRCDSGVYPCQAGMLCDANTGQCL